jgi:hypothetical protein
MAPRRQEAALSRRGIGAFFLSLVAIAAPLTTAAAPGAPDAPAGPAHRGAARGDLPQGVSPWLIDGWFAPTATTGAPRAWQTDKSPRAAMIGSFVFPGLGQMYNEREFWGLVVAGVEFYFISEWISEQRLTNRYRAIVNDDPSNQEAQVLFVLHRDNRIQATWLLGLTVLLSGVQSYVDAHLSDFDAKPPALRLAPSMTGGPSAGLQVRF